MHCRQPVPYRVCLNHHSSGTPRYLTIKLSPDLEHALPMISSPFKFNNSILVRIFIKVLAPRISGFEIKRCLCSRKQVGEDNDRVAEIDRANVNAQTTPVTSIGFGESQYLIMLQN